MATIRLVTDDAVERDCGDLLPILESEKTIARYTVLPRINAQGMTPEQLRARQVLDRPDYSILIGDSVPIVWLMAAPDGHPGRRMFGCKLFAADGAVSIDASGLATSLPLRQPFGAVSRVWYGAQSGAGLPSNELYRQWIQKAIDAPRQALAFRIAAPVNDHFAYVDSFGRDYRPIGTAARSQVPSHLLEDMRQLPSVADNTDGVWARWAEAPPAVGFSLSGGYEFAQLVGLYNVGRTEELRRIRPRTGLHVIWGSYQMDYGWQNNLPIAVTTIEGCLTSVLSQYGKLALAGYFAGRTVGSCSRAWTNLGRWTTPEDYLLDIIGDCTQAMTTDQLALSDALAKLAAAPTRAEFEALKTEVSALRTVSAGTPVASVGPAAATAAAPGWTGLIWSTGQPVAVAGVPNALPMGAYQSIVYSPTSVSAPPVTGLAPASPCRLRLHFAEMGHSAAGQRLIDVYANGLKVLSALDVYAEAGGAFRALVKEVPAIADAQGVVSIRVTPAPFSPDRNAFICAVQLVA